MRKSTVTIALASTLLLTMAILAAPTIHAKYSGSTQTFDVMVASQFTRIYYHTNVPQTITLNPGYYQIEAWGGDGGNSGSGNYLATGGIAQKVTGTFLVNSPTQLTMFVGSMGTDNPSIRNWQPGGTNGSGALNVGNGGSGGWGGTAPGLNAEGWGGAGGGSGTFVYLGGTLNSNILLAAGGGGGGGGAATNRGGNGGNGGVQPAGGATTQGINGVAGSGAAGNLAPAATTLSPNTNGGNGGDATAGNSFGNGGGGSGGGGGGFNFGGGASRGGYGGSLGSTSGSGAGGKGGSSYLSGSNIFVNMGQPTHGRPAPRQGAVIVTYLGLP